MRFIRGVLRGLFYNYIRIVYDMTAPPCCKDDSRIVVSLTTFPDRIEKVWLTVQSLLRQTYNPKSVILYLSKTQFKSEDVLPAKLLKLRSKGLSIKLVEGDLRSHKKYVYSFDEYKHSLVFLVDDDLLYPSDMLEKSLSVFDQYEGKVVVARYGREMQYNEKGELMPYLTWKSSQDWRSGVLNDGNNLFFGSGGGTLINPMLLYKDVCDTTISQNLAPYADDIWLNAQCKLAHYRIVILNSGLLFPINQKNESKLSTLNNGSENYNDVQLAKVRDYYMDNLSINPFALK